MDRAARGREHGVCASVRDGGAGIMHDGVLYAAVWSTAWHRAMLMPQAGRNRFAAAAAPGPASGPLRRAAAAVMQP